MTLFYLDANSCHNIFSGFSAFIVWNIWVQFIGEVAAEHMAKISDTFSKDLMLENLKLHSNRNTWAKETGRTLKLDDDLTTKCPLVIKSRICKRKIYVTNFNSASGEFAKSLRQKFYYDLLISRTRNNRLRFQLDILKTVIVPMAESFVVTHRSLGFGEKLRMNSCY